MAWNVKRETWLFGSRFTHHVSLTRFLKFCDSLSPQGQHMLKVIDSSIRFTSHGSLRTEWEGIRIFEGNSSSFNYCRIDSLQNGILCLNSSPTITNSWISGSENCLYLSGPDANPSIQGCELDGSGGNSDILILCDSSSAPTITNCFILGGL